MDEIDFRDPPPSDRSTRTGAWMGRLSPLVDHPKRWACVYTASTPATAGRTAGNLKQRLLKYPAGQWEFTCRGVEVFARYMGPDVLTTNQES